MVNNPTHVSQRSQSVFQSRSVFKKNLKLDGEVLKSQKKLVDYANTTNVEFVVDSKAISTKNSSAHVEERDARIPKRVSTGVENGPKGFIPWLINLQLFANI